jgi:ATP-dependent Lon protease
MDLSALINNLGQEQGAGMKGEDDQQQIPEVLPILPLKNTVIYPLTVIPLVVQKQRSIQLVDEAVVANRLIGLVALRDPAIEDPQADDLHTVGTVALVHRLVRAPDGTLHLIVQGLERFRIAAYEQSEPYLRARVEVAPESVESGLEAEALVRSLVTLFQRLVSLAAYLPEEMVANVLDTEEPRHLAYMVATSTRMDLAVRQEILEMDSVADKLRKLVDVLTREVDVLELGKKIQSDAQSGIEKVQREYYLREQLKAIQRELGEEDPQAAEVRDLRLKVEQARLPDEARTEAIRELDRLVALPAAAAEYGVIRTYLQWLTELPWQVATEDKLDVVDARRILDEDHYGLQRIKDRIIEYLAVRKLRQERAQAAEPEDEPRSLIRREREGVILCFVGPPGVGKTSLGQSVARAMGRKFIRQSLGGMHDEAEIRGHRRTYVGAMPGRIIQSIRRVGSRNPVFMLDEVDKLGADFRGDPASALLEVLDPEQNREFQDHYLSVPFDLSQVMFIATANVLDTIPAPLLDRMEILQLSGYTEEEKLNIAKGYLVARQLKENGLRPQELTFEDEALRRLIRDYTREAGVRNLERQMGAVCRKAATHVAAGSSEPIVISADRVPEYLGKPMFTYEVAERTQVPGVATGLAWTPTGGDILFVEATKMKGSRGFMITGQLGEVMRESAQAALSYVRSKASDLGIDEELFSQTDIHLHVPAGAIPKDGPSAGVTMATALASLLKGQPINPLLGMTGEITLRGQVLPVGGIKEKLLAAHRAGLKMICLPSRNERDLEELPAEIRNELTIILVDRVEQVYEVAFGTMEGKPSGQIQEKEIGPTESAHAVV